MTCTSHEDKRTSHEASEGKFICVFPCLSRLGFCHGSRDPATKIPLNSGKGGYLSHDGDCQHQSGANANSVNTFLGLTTAAIISVRMPEHFFLL